MHRQSLYQGTHTLSETSAKTYEHHLRLNIRFLLETEKPKNEMANGERVHDNTMHHAHAHAPPEFVTLLHQPFSTVCHSYSYKNGCFFLNDLISLLSHLCFLEAFNEFHLPLAVDVHSQNVSNESELES